MPVFRRNELIQPLTLGPSVIARPPDLIFHPAQQVVEVKGDNHGGLVICLDKCQERFVHHGRPGKDLLLGDLRQAVDVGKVSNGLGERALCERCEDKGVWNRGQVNLGNQESEQSVKIMAPLVSKVRLTGPRYFQSAGLYATRVLRSECPGTSGSRYVNQW